MCVFFRLGFCLCCYLVYQDLCYSTLGVSVTDKPSAERLAQFEKSAALRNINTTTTNNKNGRQLSSTPGGAAGQAPALATAPSSLSARRQKDDGRVSGRRSIPLSAGRGEMGSAPGAHIAVLARSIQAASQRKRYGGKTIAQVSCTGMLPCVGHVLRVVCSRLLVGLYLAVGDWGTGDLLDFAMMSATSV